MYVVIYVEGSSDRDAMEFLLESLIAKKQERGIAIKFASVKGKHNQRGGDAKKDILIKMPERAVDFLRNQPQSIIALMPDLYPKNKGFPHETFAELERGIMERFSRALETKGLADDSRIRERFKVFCFQHDLEVLILAAEEQLKEYLGVDSFKISWQIPVEEQNHDLPPKRIVERLFESCGKKYQESTDAPLILGSANYQQISDRCPQSFKLFIDFMESLL